MTYRKRLLAALALTCSCGLGEMRRGDALIGEIRVGPAKIGAASKDSAPVFAPPPPAAPALVAWFKLDDEGDTAVLIDSSVNAASGAVMVGQTVAAATGPGVDTRALTFPGSAYAILATAPVLAVLGTDHWTVALWLKRSGNAHAELFAGPPFWVMYCYINIDNGNLLWGTNSGEVGWPALMEPEAWAHLVFVRDGSNYYGYRNGADMGSNWSNPVGATVVPMESFWVGGAGTDYGSSRTLDDVRIYSTSLSAGAVAALYATYTVPEPPPAAPAPHLYFDAQGGYVDPAAVTLTADSYLGANCAYTLPTPWHDGDGGQWTFNYWEYWNPGSGSQAGPWDWYGAGSGDITVYANWTQNW